MALPGVKIIIGSDGLGIVPQTEDGVVGLLLSSADDASLPVGEPKQIFNLSEAEALGITESNDQANGMNAWKHIKQFYEQAGDGAELWVLLYPNSLTMAEVLDVNADSKSVNAKQLLEAAQGKIRILGIDKKGADGYIPTVVDGLWDEVWPALSNAEALAEYAASKMMPIRVLISGAYWSGSAQDLADLKQKSERHCAIVLAGTGSGERNGAVGTVTGKLAGISVQRNIGRVRDGAVRDVDAYMSDGESVEAHLTELEAIHDKGYIIWRKFSGKSGYYFNDDPTATSDADDFSSLARGRVVDKAMLLAYKVYTEEINDEVPINADGTLSASYVKALQAKIEDTINQTMTAKGEISGVKAYIDAAQNVLQTGELNIDISIQPVGYAKYINVTLGLTNVLNS